MVVSHDAHVHESNQRPTREVLRRPLPGGLRAASFNFHFLNLRSILFLVCYPVAALVEMESYFLLFKTMVSTSSALSDSLSPTSAAST